MKYYAFRSTFDKLADRMTDIESGGYTISFAPVHVGGRDWVIFATEADNG